MGEVQGNHHFVKTALIAGGTGLIGSQLLRLLLDDDRYSTVVALTRNEMQSHPKLIQHRIDGAIQLDTTSWIDDVFCCLGTTMAKAGSKEKFYQVDFTFPYELGRQSLERGAQQFLIVTALGANRNSGIYYNRVKGEIEEAVAALGFRSLHIFRPSLLLGKRTEERAGEDAAKVFYKAFGFLIPKKFKAIDSARVARAMIHFASQDHTGTFVHESGELQEF
jgi:uncharacterized protein YbjT (DUF2867 family)